MRCLNTNTRLSLVRELHQNGCYLFQFCRYAALAAGIGYGSVRLSSLTRKEVKIQEVDDAIRARRDARLVAEKEAQSKGEFD